MPGCVKSWSRAVASVAIAGTFTAIAVDNADARSRHGHRPVAHAVQRSAPPAAAATFIGDPRYAALVVDAKTGRTLYERNADDRRFPASVTKVMTMYLVFEDLERRKISLDSRISMTPHCSLQAPSKLGLRPGQTISVEDGIKAVVTKSANDVACAFAENLDGSESEFAERMTRKARSLGMSGSVFRNASGLPNPGHFTTARDLVTLGRAIQDRFPRYYGYFGTRVYVYNGRPIPNHNKLLGRVEGVDGIKTGYTNAAGFNLLTSIKKDGRSIVAVVMGGRSGPSRDAHMQQLIALNLPRAQPGTRSAPLVAEASGGMFAARTRPAVMASGPLSAPAEQNEQVAMASVPLPTAAPAPLPTPTPNYSGATPKARPIATDVRPVAAASLPAPAVSAPAPVASSSTTTPGSMRWVVGRAPTVTGSVAAPAAAEIAEPQIAEDAAPVEAPARPIRVASNARSIDASPRPAPAAEPAPVRKGWLIQIGATTEVNQAKEMLSNAKTKGGPALKSAEAFTETFVKGETTYYRARFAGLNEKSADSACKTLKRSSVSCFAIKN